MIPSVSIRLLLTQSDARLVTFARAGHERAFEALVQRYRRPLLGYCRRLLLSEERAEDALQQALLQAWLALQAGTEVSEVKPWLYRIVHNASLNVLRVSGYDYFQLNESLCGADAPQTDLDRRIAVREALAGLAALPEMQREALLRTAVEGHTHQQVARELGLSENALRGLVYRARSTLRAAASALVPPPLVGWALGSSGGRGTPVVERLSELAAGGGSAGVAGLLVKGSAVAVTASVLAGGVAVVHARPKPTTTKRVTTPHAAHHHRAAVAVTPSLSLAAARAPSAHRTADANRTFARSRAKPLSTHRRALRPRHRVLSQQSSTIPYTTKIKPPSPSVPSSRIHSSSRGRHDSGGGGDGAHHEAHSPGSNPPESGASAASRGNDSHHGSGHSEQGSDGGGGESEQRGRGRDDGSPSTDTSGSSSANDSGRLEGKIPKDGQGESSSNTSQSSGAASDGQGSPGTSSSNGDDSSEGSSQSSSDGLPTEDQGSSSQGGKED